MTASDDPTVRAIGYARVSTDGQVESGAGLGAQRDALAAEAARRGWSLEIVEDAGYSAKSMERPGLRAALERLDRRQADVLVVSRVDRMSRSVADFGALLERAQRRGWRLVALDLGVDTTTPAGELVANITASTARYERRLIGQRTREALAVRRASGVRLGRPSVLGPEVIGRVLDLRARGLGARRIAAELNAAGVPTARETGPWGPSSVQALLRSQDAALAAGSRASTTA